MDVTSLLRGRALWRGAEKIERRSNVWFNRPVRVVGTWRRARVADVNERIVEVPFAHAHVRGRRVLDVGSSESLLALELASLGHEVTALDVRRYPLAHPCLRVATDDIRHTAFPAASFDTVLAVSTIEHVGLGFYGEAPDADGDRRALREIHRLAAPDAAVVLTVPFGRAVTMPGHRVYDRRRLTALVDGFVLEEWLCCRREGPCTWTPVAAEEAEQADSSVSTEAVALLALRRPRAARA